MTGKNYGYDQGKDNLKIIIKITRQAGSPGDPIKSGRLFSLLAVCMRAYRKGLNLLGMW
jgi:hypothetical protein